MHPADDCLMITICSQAFTLKASLRAATQLNVKYRGFGNLAKAVSEASFTAYQDIITSGCTDPAALNAFLKPFHDPKALMRPLGDSMLANREELLEFVFMLAGGKSRESSQTEPADPISFEAYHSKLFEIATGRLGWTPSDAWEATPAEIRIANDGKLAMLRAIHGSNDDATDDVDLDNAKARAELNALGDTKILTMQEVRHAV